MSSWIAEICKFLSEETINEHDFFVNSVWEYFYNFKAIIHIIKVETITNEIIKRVITLN